jgi:NADH-quinone oxidoreductase subunit L
VPLGILAFFAMALGLIGTPAWPWFRAFLDGRAAGFDVARLYGAGAADADGDLDGGGFSGLGWAWKLYGDRSPKPDGPDALEKAVRPWAWAGCAAGFMWMSSTE